MIALTRISGQPFVLNCDLIERIDVTPDTVVSLVDGKKYVVPALPRRDHRSQPPPHARRPGPRRRRADPPVPRHSDHPGGVMDPAPAIGIGAGFAVVIESNSCECEAIRIGAEIIMHAPARKLYGLVLEGVLS